MGKTPGPALDHVFRLQVSLNAEADRNSITCASGKGVNKKKKKKKKKKTCPKYYRKSVKVLRVPVSVKKKKKKKKKKNPCVGGTGVV